MTLREELKRIRKASKLTQDALAVKAGVTQGTISQIETGVMTSISFELAAKLCEVLGVAMDFFTPFLAPGVSVPPPPSNQRTLTVLGTVAAGTMDVPELFTTESITIPVSESYPKGSFALKVVGRSCEKWHILNGDIVVVVPSTDLIEGEFYVVGSAEGHTLKAYRDGKLWQFRPDDVEPVEFKLSGSCRVVGHVAMTYGPRKFGSIEMREKRSKKQD